MFVTYLSYIKKTRLYNFDPLQAHYFIVKLGFTGVYIIFLISAQKHRLWILVRTASPRRFWRVPTIYVLSRNKKKYQFFYMKIFSFWRWNFLYILNRRVSVMVCLLYLLVWLVGCVLWSWFLLDIFIPWPTQHYAKGVNSFCLFRAGVCVFFFPSNISLETLHLGSWNDTIVGYCGKELVCSCLFFHSFVHFPSPYQNFEHLCHRFCVKFDYQSLLAYWLTGEGRGICDPLVTLSSVYYFDTHFGIAHL